MGFREVFISLQETFPQVDFRLLKAVAIEHANDVDAAAEFVITEVLSLGQLSKVDDRAKHISIADSSGVKVSDDVSSETKNPAVSGYGKDRVYIEIADDEEEENVDHLSRPKCMVHTNNLVIIDDDKVDRLGLFDNTNDHNSTLKEVSLEELELTGAATKSDPAHFTEQKHTEITIDNALHHKLHAESADTNLFKVGLHAESADTNLFKVDADTSRSDDHVMTGFAIDSASAMQTTEPFITKTGGNVTTFSNIDGVNISNIEINLPNNLDGDNGHSFQPVKYQNFVISETSRSPLGAYYALSENSLDFLRGSNDSGSLGCNVIEGSHKQHSSFLNEDSVDLLHLEAAMLSSHENYQNASAASQSSQYVGIEFLDSFVSDAKSNKENLVSSMESVIKMMADVTIIEEKAKQATKEASDAGQETFSKVEELKKTLKHAKEQNDRTAGEVYGEKAILSTEARELQSRLLNLSDERNKALSTVEQIRESLKLRIMAAEAEIAAAESEKLEKEAVAEALLEEQELIMDSIVQDAKRLQQEAEENSKLREFLMDRGRLVDTLQGEIAVICEDVLALKRRVESGLPLERLSQSTASSLASSLSLSSVRSKSSTDVAVQSADTDNFPPADVAEESHMVAQPDDKTQPEDKICLDDQKEAADDDWEIFEMI